MTHRPHALVPAVVAATVAASVLAAAPVSTPGAGNVAHAAPAPVAASPWADARTAPAPSCGRPVPLGSTPAQRGIGAPATSARTTPGFGHSEVDVRSEALDVGWDGRTLTGRADIALAATRPTTTLTLDLSSRLRVTSARLDGRPVPVTRGAHTLTVRTPRLAAGAQHRLAVAYSGRPVAYRDVWAGRGQGLGWSVRRDGSVTTYAEPVGTSTWAPVNETPADKALFSARVTTRGATTAVFNGVRCGFVRRGGVATSTFSARAPMPAYLVTLTLGRYRPHAVALGGGRTATIWVRPVDERAVPGLARSLRRSYASLTARLGAYPFPSLGVVVTDGGGAMETQTMISMNRDLLDEETVLHELAHQWFGDAVTTRTWDDVWLNEGFAQFMEMQLPTSVFDRSLALEGCRDAAHDDGQASRVRPGHLLGGGPYLCGALALAQLRDQAGPARFWSAMAGWPRSRPYGTASRADFAAYWRRATGKDASPVLATWLDRVDARTTTRARIR